MSQPETKSKPVSASKRRNVFAKLGGILGENFLPKEPTFDGEEIQKVIQMAPYRASVPRYFTFLGFLLLVVAIAGFAVVSFSRLGGMTELTPEQVQVLDNIEMVGWALTIAALLLFFKATQSALAYQQWKFIITDKRIIITTPDPDRKWFADSLYLKSDTLKVLDTNYSTDPIWVIFQTIHGSRDVMLSASAYAFMENGAKVRDALRFPDMMPEDIKELEKLIFGGKK